MLTLCQIALLPGFRAIRTPDFRENYQNAIRIGDLPGFDLGEQATAEGTAIAVFLRCLSGPNRTYFLLCGVQGTGY
jgi:hypothetical protein